MKFDQVGEQHADLAFLGGSRRRRIDAEAIGHGGGEVRPERRVESTELAGSLDEERHLVAAGSLLAEVIEDGFRRLTPFVGGGDLGDGPGVPAVDPAQRRLEVEAAEGRGQRTAPAILLASPERDRHEGEQHQHVPLPPAQPPVPAQRHGGERLGQEHEGDRNGHGDHAPAALVDAEIAPGGDHIQRDRHEAEGDERAGRFLRRRRTLERRQVGERHDRPDGHQRDQAPEEDRPVAQDGDGPRTGQPAGRRRGEAGTDDEADRRGDRESGIRAIEQDARRRQRVQSEEPGAGEEGQRHEQQPCVAVTAGGDVGHVGQDHAHGRREQHEPEVARMVLPLEIDLRLGEQQREPGERQQQDPGPRPRQTGPSIRPPDVARHAARVLASWPIRDRDHPGGKSTHIDEPVGR